MCLYFENLENHVFVFENISKHWKALKTICVYMKTCENIGNVASPKVDLFVKTKQQQFRIFKKVTIFQTQQN